MGTRQLSNAMSEVRKSSSRVPVKRERPISPTSAPRKKKVQKIYAKKPGDKPLPQPKTSASASPAPREPAKLTPLPTQDKAVEIEQWMTDVALKSIEESGNLEESLERTRQRWVHGGVLEKYWTKPSKAKNRPDNPGNPPKESMQKLGPATLVVKPLSFEVMLYGIVDLSQRHMGSGNVQNRPIIQYNAPTQPQAGSSLKNPPTTQSPAISAHQPAQTAPAPTPNPAPAPAPASAPTTTAAPAPVPASTPAPIAAPAVTPQSGANLNYNAQRGPPAQASTPQQSSSNNGGFYNPSSAPPPQPPQQAPPPPPVQNPKQPQDPVIQMLAQRASTNPSLKELMKIVADGNANKEQLAIFQGHIDDISSIWQRQQQASRAPAPPVPPPAPVTPAPQPPRFSGNVQQKKQYPASPVPPPPNSKQAPTSKGIAPSTSAKIKPNPPSKPDYAGVAIEFQGNAHDRFWFPKQAIVEFLPEEKLAKASFLLIRRGATAADPSHLDPIKTYHQPVTVWLTADDPKTLKPLSRAVPPPEEVRKNMEDAMSKTSQADFEPLLLQVPVNGEDKENNTSSPVPVDRRNALKSSAAARPSPAAASKNNKNKQDDFGLRCRCCFATVASKDFKDGEGRYVCQSCKKLRDENGSGEQKAPTGPSNSLPLRHISGPQALVFGE
ncbi:MAG: hypothetical protein M1831_006844 [Alyxoria varia]|nr:MAG: hypothetical protein M1831_006844 [Alyxoria varia]